MNIDAPLWWWLRCSSPLELILFIFLYSSVWNFTYTFPVDYWLRMFYWTVVRPCKCKTFHQLYIFLKLYTLLLFIYKIFKLLFSGNMNRHTLAFTPMGEPPNQGTARSQSYRVTPDPSQHIPQRPRSVTPQPTPPDEVTQ